VDRVVRVPAPAPAPPPPLPPPVVAAPTPERLEDRVITTVLKEKSVWEGTWRQEKVAVPMFRLSPDGEGVGGTCAANWGNIAKLRGGSVKGDVLEFVVDADVSPVHIRMAMTGEGKAKVEQWVTADDWMVSLERANKIAKTVQQRRVLHAVLEKNAQTYRKPVVIGTFIRQAAD
jgi:hypothetical protein